MHLRPSVAGRLAAVATIVLMVAACGGDSTPSASASAPSSAAPAATDAPSAIASASLEPVASEPAASPAASRDFEPIKLEGSGRSKATFTLPGDAPAIATASYAGTGKFAYASLAADGSQIRVLVNVTGKYDGTVLANSNEHVAAFVVDADGPWTIVVAPLASAKAWDPSVALTGTGDDVLQVVPASTSTGELSLDYKGVATFGFVAIGTSGAKVLANAPGSFTGMVTLPAGTMLISVTARGPWTATP